MPNELTGGSLNTGQTASLHTFYNLSFMYHPTIRRYITANEKRRQMVSSFLVGVANEDDTVSNYITRGDDRGFCTYLTA
jgi:hypothetical protein